MDKTPIEYRRALADQITNPETETGWISPIPVDESRDYLTALPDQYATVGDGYRIADIGSGDGTLTVALAERYPEAEVVGIDIAPQYTQDAVAAYREETGNENAKAIGGDVYDVLPELEPFDFIYTVNMLQDANDFDAAVETITDATRDDAYVGATFTDEEAKHLFGDFLEYDEEEGAEYWVFEDLDLDNGTTVSFKQRIIPEPEAVETFGDHGFEPVDRQELRAEDRYLEDALNTLDPDNDLDADKLEPSFPFYLFHRGDGDGQ